MSTAQSSGLFLTYMYFPGPPVQTPIQDHSYAVHSKLLLPLPLNFRLDITTVCLMRIFRSSIFKIELLISSQIPILPALLQFPSSQ